MKHLSEGELKAMLDDVVVEHGASPTGYFGVALEFAQSVELIWTPGLPVLVTVIGANMAHSVELALRAFLLSKMTLREVRGVSSRHDLERLWAEAVARGLPIEVAVPRWCHVLNAGRGDPYLYRYPQESTGTVVPGEGMEGLRDLLAKVAAALGLDGAGNVVSF